MTTAPDGPAACRRALEAALSDPARLDPAPFTAAAAADLDAALREFAADRKSTRLNSSH